MTVMPLPTIIVHAFERESAYSGKASDVVRPLGLAGMGLAWMLAGGLTTSDPKLAFSTIGGSTYLSATLTMCAMALIADALQYTWSTIAWGSYGRVLGRVWDARDGNWEGSDVQAAWWLASFFQIDRMIIKAARGSLSDIEKNLNLPSRERKQHAHSLLKECRGTVEGVWAEPRSPNFITVIGGLLFSVKILLVLAAYISLLCYIFPLILVNP